MTIDVKTSLTISHGQIAVFDPSFEAPFNEWTDQHFRQGFTWRNGSVSFATLEESGPHRVMIDQKCDALYPVPAIRVIDVPFAVPSGGKIEIAGIADSAFLDVMPGLY